MCRDEDGVAEVLNRIRSALQHGTASIIIEIREHEIVDIKENLDYRKGKEFAKHNS